MLEFGIFYLYFENHMKILVIQQKMIGDVLTSSILFNALREKYADAHLDYLINEHTFAVVENNPFIDNFIFFTKKEEDSIKALFKLANSVKNTNYDIVIDVYSKFSSNLISWYSGAKIRISKYKWYTSLIYTNTIKESSIAKTNAGLAIENRLQMLEPILKENSRIFKPAIHLKNEELINAKAFLETHNINLEHPIIMISVLGSGDNKTYPLPYMAKLIDVIVEKTNAQLLFNFIPKQEPDAKEVYNLCKESTRKKIYFDAYGKNLREFLSITQHCNALIGNEGGAVNMAKALSIPTFTIFSPWIQKDAWNMFEDGETNISIHLEDVKPEHYLGKSYKEMKKISEQLYIEFSPDQIIPKLNKFLKNF